MAFNPNAPGYRKWSEVGKKLHGKTLPQRKGIEDLTLEELLEKEKKFLEWFPTTKSSDKEVVEHKYKTYIRPRIEKLQKEGTPL